MITFAKIVTNGVIPMGGVIVRKPHPRRVHERARHAVELFHGYTYSGHPVAARRRSPRSTSIGRGAVRARASSSPNGRDAMHGLKGVPNVLDIRTLGLVAGIDLAAKPDAVGKRAYDAMERAFHEHDIVLRITGDTHRADAAAHHLRGGDRARSPTRCGR